MKLKMFMKPKMLRVYIAAIMLGAKIKIDSSIKHMGAWDGTFILLREDAEAITLLHELGHHICGLSCCEEHREYMAHGACIFLAKLLRVHYMCIDRDMDAYATIPGCPRLKKFKVP